MILAERLEPVATTPPINYLAVVLATIAAMAIGFVYYHPKVMGTRWAAAIGHTEESMAKGPKPWVYPLLILCAFVTAWVLAGAGVLSLYFYGGSFFWNVLLTAWILFVGFTAARVVVHDAFDPRGFKVTVHTLLNEFIIVTVMALIIGLWAPAGLESYGSLVLEVGKP
ncbi:MAG: DUF1761 domain-containing protein [Arthrobacter sp.]|jgi:hypothetical protein|nr:DUF1761 domain-containing protein [Arthrobacter sp.]